MFTIHLAGGPGLPREALERRSKARGTLGLIGSGVPTELVTKASGQIGVVGSARVTLVADGDVGLQRIGSVANTTRISGQIGLTGAANTQPAFINGYLQRIEVSIQDPRRDGVGTESLPQILDITLDVLKSTANGGVITSNFAWDIQLYQSDDSTTVPFIIRYHNPVTGRLVITLRHPAADLDGPTNMILYAGNAAITESHENPVQVGQGHAAWWIMPTGEDLTIAGNTMTPVGTDLASSPLASVFSAATGFWNFDITCSVDFRVALRPSDGSSSPEILVGDLVGSTLTSTVGSTTAAQTIVPASGYRLRVVILSDRVQIYVDGRKVVVETVPAGVASWQPHLVIDGVTYAQGTNPPLSGTDWQLDRYSYAGLPTINLPDSSRSLPETQFDGGAVYKGDIDGRYLSGVFDLTVLSLVNPDTAMLNTNLGWFTVGELDGDIGTSDLSFGFFATVGTGASNVVHFKTRFDTDNDNGFFLGQTDSAETGLQALAGQSDNGGLTVYERDGAYTASASGTWATGLVIPPGVPVYIGTNGSGSNETSGNFEGAVAEIRIAASSLTEAQITSRLSNMLDPLETITYSPPRSVSGDAQPLPRSDFATTTEEAQIDIEILANDDLNGGTIASVSQPPNGSMSLSSNVVTYTPDVGFTGIDRSTYHLSKGGILVPARQIIQVGAGGGGGANPLYTQLPIEAQATVTVTPSNFVSTVEGGLAPGTFVRMLPGDYAGLEFTINNSNSQLPIIIMPNDPTLPIAQQAKFRGRTNVRGSNIQFWGCVNNSKGAGTAGHRAFNVLNADNIGFYYCDIQPAAIGVEVIGMGGTGYVFDRCRFYNPDQLSGNGMNATKLGGGEHYNYDQQGVMRYCMIQDFRSGREAISIKAAGWLIYRSHFIDSNDFAFRQCAAVTAQECRVDGTIGNRKFQIAGRDHRIINCLARRFEVDTGSLPGDLPNPPNNNFRPAATRVLLAHTTATDGSSSSHDIGHIPFGDQQWNVERVDGTRIFSATGQVDVTSRAINTTFPSTLSPEIAPVTPVTLSINQVGYVAYQTQVQGIAP